MVTPVFRGGYHRIRYSRSEIVGQPQHMIGDGLGRGGYSRSEIVGQPQRNGRCRSGQPRYSRSEIVGQPQGAKVSSREVARPGIHERANDTPRTAANATGPLSLPLDYSGLTHLFDLEP